MNSQQPASARGESFYGRRDETKMPVQRRKSSWPPVRRRSSAYDRYLTDIRDMICARCGGTRIPNKNINCTCQGSKGKGEARTNRENQLDSAWTNVCDRVSVFTCVCVWPRMYMYTLSLSLSLSTRHNLKGLGWLLPHECKRAKREYFSAARGREKRRGGEGMSSSSFRGKRRSRRGRRWRRRRSRRRRRKLLGEHSRQTPPVVLSADEDGWRLSSTARERKRKCCSSLRGFQAQLERTKSSAKGRRETLRTCPLSSSLFVFLSPSGLRSQINNIPISSVFFITFNHFA